MNDEATPTLDLENLPNKQDTLDIALFPLKTVLFPGGKLPLKIFEQRYLDMSAECMRLDKPFGICLIVSGDEVGTPASPHAIGTLAHISDWAMEQFGILQLGVRGGQRFRVLDVRVARGGLLRGHVELLPECENVAVPIAHADLVALLRRIVAEFELKLMPDPQPWNDAQWLSYRLSEVVPQAQTIQQQLLALDDPLARLALIRSYLVERGLVEEH